jgi:hypothetical protein
MVTQAAAAPDQTIVIQLKFIGYAPAARARGQSRSRANDYGGVARSLIFLFQCDQFKRFPKRNYDYKAFFCAMRQSSDVGLKPNSTNPLCGALFLSVFGG